MLGIIEEINEAEERSKAAKEERNRKKVEIIDIFKKCEKNCTCGEVVCMARGLRQCSTCKDVFRNNSKCEKKKCKQNGFFNVISTL